MVASVSGIQQVAYLGWAHALALVPLADAAFNEALRRSLPPFWQSCPRKLLNFSQLGFSTLSVLLQLSPQPPANLFLTSLPAFFQAFPTVLPESFQLLPHYLPAILKHSSNLFRAFAQPPPPKK